MCKTLRLFSKQIILISFLFLSNLCYSQSIENTSFHKLDIHGVIFNKKVNTLFEDSYGFLWIGTNNGLFKYDGYTLIQYQHNVFDPFSLPNNSINSIVEDQYHNLWIGSESYLIHFERNKEKFKGFYKNATSTILSFTNEKKLWVNVKYQGIINITPTEEIDSLKLAANFISKSIPTILNIKKPITSLVQDNFNRNWVTTRKGIALLNKNNNEYKEYFFKQKINNLKLFSNNKIIATTNNDLYVLGYNKSNNNLEILEKYPDLLEKINSKGLIYNISIDPKNNDVWIGTTGGLIKGKRKSNKFNFCIYSKNTNNNLLDNNITTTIFDSYGNLWIGSSKGINKHFGRTSLFEYQEIKNDNILSTNTNTSIYYQGLDQVLVGMTDGLHRYDSNKNSFTKIHSELNNVNIITHNYEKTELIVSNNLNIYKSKNFNQTSNKIDLHRIKHYNRDVKDILAINKNEIWVALWGKGLDIINDEAPLSNFKKEVIKELNGNYTSVLLLTSDNELWIGTRGAGIYIADLNNETIKHYLPTIENGLTSNAILSLYEDSRNNIWVGTRGGGLNLFNKKTKLFNNFDYTNKTIPNIISNIQEDLKGNIWVSTNNGLSKYDIKTRKFINFGVEDGINENQFIFNSSTKNASKNFLFFGCSEGFYKVLPNNFTPKTKTPTTVITNFSTIGKTNNNDPINSTENNTNINIYDDKLIVLPYDQNNISFTFSSLDLTSPDKNEYTYRLKGLNNYWIRTSSFNRNANYNGLSPGNYTFMVKSSNSDGVWNKKPTEVKFKITPPYWRSKWALLLYFILTLIILHIISLLIKRYYRLNENLVKETISREKDNELNRMKMIFFTDISHELRTPLSLILGTIEKVVKEKKFTLNPVTSQRIYNNTLRMQRLINQIMDVRKFDDGKFKLKISKNDIVKDINIIKSAFNDFAQNSDIEYDFITDEKEILGWYDVDILEKILFNLLSNAFKYTKENGKISVSLNLIKSEGSKKIKDNKLSKGTYIECSVTDNGIGIPKEELKSIFDRYYQATAAQKNQIPGTGIGMELVQKLISRHHGFITVESEENVSTVFSFYIPVNKSKYPKKERIQVGTPLKKNFIKSSEYQIIEEISSKKTKVKTEENSKPKVLLVEDHDELRTMVKEELSDDFTVIEATNGTEGYEMAQKEKPELIVSDILMPIEDGLSMLKRIKKNTEINNIPMFMLTAKHAEETKIECLSLGANDYIEKPFSLEFLKWKIKNTFSTRKELKKKYSKLITTAPSNIEVDSNDEKFIKKLIKIIEENMNNNLLNVEFLASEIGMSRANLYRKVQSILNDTPVNFIKTIKLKRAVQLLKKNQMYISEVAYMTGFNNQKYFSKCFHKEYGMSPTEFIKNNAHDDEIEQEKE